jgi:broad specificity phosphatase PhoE
VKLLYVIRHATTTDNERYLLSGARAEVPLSPAGVQECNELKDKLTGVKFDCVFCSPLPRAVETCVRAGFNLKDVVMDPLVVEKSFGVFEGQAIGSYEDVVRGLDPGQLLHFVPQGGESFYDLRIRAEMFLSKVLAHPGHTIALFSHAAFNRSLIGVLEDIPFANWLDISQGNAGITQLKLTL